VEILQRHLKEQSKLENGVFLLALKSLSNGLDWERKAIAKDTAENEKVSDNDGLNELVSVEEDSMSSPMILGDVTMTVNTPGAVTNSDQVTEQVSEQVSVQPSSPVTPTVPQKKNWIAPTIASLLTGGAVALGAYMLSDKTPVPDFVDTDSNIVLEIDK